MVQNMMRNDPRFANNPMLQQSLDALRSNPEMVNQFSQVMSDPNVRDRMATMMSQQRQPGGSGGTGGSGGPDPFGNGPEEMRRQMEQFQRMSQQHGGTSGGFNAGGGGGANDNNGSAAGGGGGTAGNDSEATEEEMIAEAIARSLRES